VIFLGAYQEKRRETFLETRMFPGGKYQWVLSSAVLSLACSITLSLFNQSLMSMEGGVLFSSIIIVFLAIGLPQLLDFRKMQGEILDKGIAVQLRHRRRVRLSSVISFGLVFGPFMLLFIAPPIMWFGSVLGMIIGLAAAQLVFTLYIKGWERSHQIQLRRYTKWYYNEHNRRVILEYGVKREEE
jgi:hypothetical protein